MHAPRLEACLFRQTAEDQEGSRACEPPALCVQEELGPVASIEKRPAAGEVATKCVDGLAPEGHDPLLVALARGADEAPFEVDAATLEPDCLADAEARAVEQLDQRVVAHRPRRRSLGGFDQPLGLARGERAREAPRPAG